MAGLHCGLLFCVMPCLVHLTDQFSETKNCTTIKQKWCKHAEIQCSANGNLTNARVAGPYNINTSKKNTCLNMTPFTSQDGRLQLTCSGNTAHLLINHVQHSDAGTYCFYLKTDEDPGFFYQADLQIEGSSEVPNITVEKMDMKIVCKATGGCPVGTIQWADGSGTNWTQSATSEEKNGVLTSTLPLQKSSGTAEYYCTVTYWHLDKRENQTRHIAISEEQHTQKSVDAVGSEEPKYAVYVLAAVLVLICAFVALRIYYRRRGAHQANDVPGQRSPLDQDEMALVNQSSETCILDSSLST